jgi:hypothetical protein
MNASRILLLLVLIVLVLIFLFGLTLGFLHPGETAQKPEDFRLADHPWIEGMTRKIPQWAQRSSAFTVDGPGCPGHAGKSLGSGDVLTIAQAANCDLVIPPAGRRFLVIPAPQSQTVSFTVSAGTVKFMHHADTLNKTDASWPAGPQVRSLTVPQGGGPLSLSCAAGPPCSLAFK